VQVHNPHFFKEEGRGEEEGINCRKCPIQRTFNVINSKISGPIGSINLFLKRIRTILAIKISKTRLKNELDDKFLSNNLIVNIEKDLLVSFVYIL